MDNTFKLEHLVQTEGAIVTNETSLSICLRAGGFYFSLIDAAYRLKAVGDFSVDLEGSIPKVMMNIKTCFSSIGVHIFNFRSIRVVCESDRMVWIPYKLYDKDKNKEYLKNVCPVYSSDTIIANIVEKLDAVNIFACPLHQYSGIRVVMPSAKFVTPSEVLASFAYDVSSFMKNTLILHNDGKRCSYAVFKGNEFTISNSFAYSTPDDLIYFLLLSLQKLEINTAEVNLMLTGEKFSKEALNYLRKYIKYVTYANYAENISVGMDFDDVDLQKYFFVLV